MRGCKDSAEESFIQGHRLGVDIRHIQAHALHDVDECEARRCQTTGAELGQNGGAEETQVKQGAGLSGGARRLLSVPATGVDARVGMVAVVQNGRVAGASTPTWPREQGTHIGAQGTLRQNGVPDSALGCRPDATPALHRINAGAFARWQSRWGAGGAGEIGSRFEAGHQTPQLGQCLDQRGVPFG